MGMKEKNFLTSEDILHLSPEQSNLYNQFINSIRQNGIIHKYELEEYAKILKQQYEKGILTNVTIHDRYTEILVANLNKIVDEITEKRNDFIGNSIDLSYINEGLDILKEFLNRGNLVDNHTGSPDLKRLLDRIDQLQKQISQDIKYYASYSQEKQKAYTDYKWKQEQYDNLSLFGKLAARINGKKRKLEAARHNYTSKFGMETPSNRRQEGQIFNSTSYEEYLKSQEMEQSTGGRSR